MAPGIPTITTTDVSRLLGLDPPEAGPAAAVVTGVAHDSARVRPGDMYAALPGRRHHGASFAAEAVARGATAVLTDAAGEALLPGGFGSAVPVLVAPDPRAVLGAVASFVHGDPSHDVAVAGVTGTNGKTTVTWMVHHLLRSCGVPAGLVGTVAVRIVDDERPSLLTTPEATDMQRLLAEMRDREVQAAAVEVSSHALALGRIDGTRMAVVAFTNLSRDHLDFHGDMESYLAAKTRLFTGGFGGRAVVCTDDEAGVRVAAAARQAGLHVTTVRSAVSGAGAEADGHTGGSGGEVPDVLLETLGTGTDGRQHARLTVRSAGPEGGATLDMDLPMPGRHNAVNAAVAVAVADALLDELGRREVGTGAGGTDRLRVLSDAMAGFAGVPGRMERIVEPAAPGRTPLVVVDYAHTPDAVATALRSLRAATPGRLVVVLGAGGGRDAGKRGPMGAAAAAVADVVVVTDDNPRDEDPAVIRAAVLDGAVGVVAARDGTDGAGAGAGEGAGAGGGAGAIGRRAGDVVEVADRALAVSRALACCSGPEDTVLVTGKGHETGQQYGPGDPAPFDDRAVAAAALRAWAAEAGVLDHGAGATAAAAC